MKKLLPLFIVFCLNCFVSTAQNVGIGTTTPSAKLSVGATSQFRVDLNGNITRINNIPYSFPATQGAANQVLKNDGAGNLTWGTVPVVVKIFTLVNNGTSSWLIDNVSDYVSPPFNSNPTLTLHRGLTYQFNVTVVGHPFVISATQGGTPFTVGITNNAAQGSVLTFTVPMDAPSTMAYYCQAHPGSMFGTININ